MNDQEIKSEALRILKEIIFCDDEMMRKGDFALDTIVFNHIYDARLLLKELATRNLATS